MIAGVTALGIVTIPMGFQFLAVLGGKALLLAKMALMLAMMNGLKRVFYFNSSIIIEQSPSEHNYILIIITGSEFWRSLRSISQRATSSRLPLYG